MGNEPQFYRQRISVLSATNFNPFGYVFQSDGQPNLEPIVRPSDFFN